MKKIIKNADVLKAMNWRYATKTFDPKKKVSDDDFKTIIEAGRLAPSSVGMEPWKFIVVKNPDLRSKLREAAYGQTKITDASHLVIIAQRTDAINLPKELIKRVSKNQGRTADELSGLKDMAENTIANFKDTAVLNGWIKAQTYIALGIMIETSALLGADTCPMEGFDYGKVNEILGLAKENLSASVMLAIGYRGDDAFAKLPKTRRGYDEVVKVV